MYKHEVAIVWKKGIVSKDLSQHKGRRRFYSGRLYRLLRRVGRTFAGCLYEAEKAVGYS